MVDVFNEIDEQLRAERIRTLGRKGAPWAIGVVVAVLLAVLAVWGVQTYRERTAATASLAYAKGLETLSRGDVNAAFNQFGAAVASPSKIYHALALMQQAGIRLDQARAAEAVGLLDKAAAVAPDVVIADSARLKAAYALLDTAPYNDLEGRLRPLMAAERPYRAEAREALAMAKLRVGRTAEARSDFVVLSLLSDATDDMRERARGAMALIDSGSAAALPALTKAALTAPPSSAASPVAANASGASAASEQPSQAGAAQ